MNDEKLTLYYYNDGLSRDERQQVVNMLASEQDVAKRYQSICRQLDSLAEVEGATAPPDMVERWHESINRAARAAVVDSPNPVLHTWSFIWGAAITAALAIGIGIGIYVSGDNASEVIVPNTLITSSRNSNAFVRGLQVHLRESEQGLSATPFNSTADRTLLIMSIIEQNRLFERVAQQNDSDGLARVLRSFELVLVRLAADDISAPEAAELQTKLLFELNVVLTKLARDTSDESQTI
jgi:hypothetical protein